MQSHFSSGILSISARVDKLTESAHATPEPKNRHRPDLIPHTFGQTGETPAFRIPCRSSEARQQKMTRKWKAHQAPYHCERAVKPWLRVPSLLHSQTLSVGRSVHIMYTLGLTRHATQSWTQFLRQPQGRQKQNTGTWNRQGYKPLSLTQSGLSSASWKN